MPAKKTAKKKPTKRSPHPGVVLLRRKRASGHTYWRARFKDPKTGRTAYEALDRFLTTAESRRDWAIAKAKKIAGERRDIELGKPVRRRRTGRSAAHGP